MSIVKQIHDEAMRIYQDAIILSVKGKDSDAEKEYEKAYRLESDAAELVSQKPNSEPTRSILFRSAATLAYQAGDYDNSLNLIGKCLSGNPTVRIKNEIRELYEKICSEYRAI